MSALVDRYLAAVGRRLPEKDAKDIIAELREAIGARLEAREAESGRSASADDEAAVLKDFGHPNIVASRYAGREYLIGPQLYPWFWPAQRMAVGAVVAINMVIALFRAVQSDRPVQAVMQGVNAAIMGGLIMFAIVVAVFVMLERAETGARYERKWDPRRLPRDDVRKPKSLFESVISLTADAIFIGVWLGLIQVANHWPDRTPSVELAFGDVWGAVHTPILVLAFVSAAVHVADIFHPAWSRLRAVTSLAAYAAGLAVMWVLLRADTLVEVIPAGEAGGAPLAGDINLFVRLTLLAITLAWAVAGAVEAGRLVRNLRSAKALRDAA